MLDQPEAVGHPFQVIQRDGLGQLGVGHQAAIFALDGGTSAVTILGAANPLWGLGR